MSSRYPISKRIRSDLKHIEHRLSSIAAEAGGELGEACASTLTAGGKRLRPALVLVCGTSGDYDLDVLMHPAVAVELVHMASLVHDDILDGAPTRRGLPSVHAKWGTRMGVAAGDYLFSRAFDVIGGSPVKQAATMLAGTALDLTSGELMQRAGARRVDITRSDYLARIRAKTASLFRTSCGLGALSAGAATETVDALGAYGENLGMAFQIYDDVLDVTGDTDALGKEVGADFRDGTLTLPMMLAAEALERDDWLLATMSENAGPEAVSAALATIESTEAPRQAKEIARGYVHRAVEATAGVEPKSVRRALADIGNYVIERYD